MQSCITIARIWFEIDVTSNIGLSLTPSAASSATATFGLAHLAWKGLWYDISPLQMIIWRRSEASISRYCCGLVQNWYSSFGGHLGLLSQLVYNHSRRYIHKPDAFSKKTRPQRRLLPPSSSCSHPRSSSSSPRTGRRNTASDGSSRRAS